MWGCLLLCVLSGGVLLSHVGYHAVPSALRGLASGFGMGPGVSHLAMTAVTLWNYQPPTPSRGASGGLFQNRTVDAHTRVCLTYVVKLSAN